MKKTLIIREESIAAAGACQPEAGHRKEHFYADRPGIIEPIRADRIFGLDIEKLIEAGWPEPGAVAGAAGEGRG